MSLTNEDREALIDAVLDDAARQDGFTVLGPGGTDGNTPTLNEAVEQIVARHATEARAAALNEAQVVIERRRTARRMRWMRRHRWPADVEANWSRGMWDAARIVRNLAATPPP